MLKLVAMPRNLTTKLWELNHLDSSFSKQKKGNLCFTMGYILPLFLLTLIAHIFSNSGQTRGHTSWTQLTLQIYCFITFSLFQCISIFHLDPIIWCCITVSVSLKINKLLSYLDLHQSHICIRCECLLKNNWWRFEWINRDGRLWNERVEKKTLHWALCIGQMWRNLHGANVPTVSMKCEAMLYRSVCVTPCKLISSMQTIREWREEFPMSLQVDAGVETSWAGSSIVNETEAELGDLLNIYIYIIYLYIYLYVMSC